MHRITRLQTGSLPQKKDDSENGKKRKLPQQQGESPEVIKNWDGTERKCGQYTFTILKEGERLSLPFWQIAYWDSQILHRWRTRCVILMRDQEIVRARVHYSDKKRTELLTALTLPLLERLNRKSTPSHNAILTERDDEEEYVYSYLDKNALSAAVLHLQTFVASEGAEEKEEKEKMEEEEKEKVAEEKEKVAEEKEKVEEEKEKVEEEDEEEKATAPLEVVAHHPPPDGAATSGELLQEKRSSQEEKERENSEKQRMDLQLQVSFLAAKSDAQARIRNMEAYQRRALIAEIASNAISTMMRDVHSTVLSVTAKLYTRDATTTIAFTSSSHENEENAPNKRQRI